MAKLTDAPRAEYQQLFDSCQIRSDRAAEVDAAANRILADKARYAALAKQLELPWYVIGVLHSLLPARRRQAGRAQLGRLQGGVRPLPGG